MIGAPSAKPATTRISDHLMNDLSAAIYQDIERIGRIEAVPTLLRVLCQITGMGFAAVARVTDDSWTACAVQDDIQFGLGPGGQLDVHTTLCKEVREARTPIVIDHASADRVYCNHHTPKLYSIESYVSVPIMLGDGSYFGNLCAIDPRPAKVSEPKIVNTFVLFAQLIALELENQRRHEQTQQALLSEKEAGELREQFIAVLGHDLRNPLSAIFACTQLIDRRAADAAEVRTLVSRITTNVKRMAA
ncbi:MAG: GAF domain-containing protein, partial [Burkholderiaceae bacterium]